MAFPSGCQAIMLNGVPNLKRLLICGLKVFLSSSRNSAERPQDVFLDAKPCDQLLALESRLFFQRQKILINLCKLLRSVPPQPSTTDRGMSGIQD
ncbi:hypothetical protein ACU8KH_00194 [Lachancea thermotolerans]